MTYRAVLSFFALAFLMVIFLAQGTGCANIIPPQGGPKDTLPPDVVKINPPDRSTGFTGNRITFTFDEYINLDNAQQNLLITPIPETPPVVDSRLNTVTVKLRDTLEPNTTYTFNFGNAIKDYNEGNVLKDFSYTFSTGDYMDSLQLKGHVLLAETGKTDTTLIVMLHINGDDSAVVKNKPRYVARLDSKGAFVFRNLPDKPFYIYALKNESGTYRYLDDKTLFAFADAPVRPGPATDPVTLYAWAVSPETARFPGFDLLKGNDQGARRLRVQNNLQNNQQDLLTPLQLSFSEPLKNFDPQKVGFFTDSSFVPVTDSLYHFRTDSTKKKIILDYTWDEGRVYHLVFAQDFAEDSSGKKLLKADTLSFISKRKADYGSLKIRFRNLDSASHPVLQLVQGDVIQQSYPLGSDVFTRALVLPGEYQLRILSDTNGNGRWDPGSFFDGHRQPELVKPVERKITVKANWQNEFEILL